MKTCRMVHLIRAVGLASWLALALVLAVPTWGAVVPVGAVSRIEGPNFDQPRRVVFRLGQQGACEVVVLAPDTVRVRYHFTMPNPFWDKDEEALAKPPDQWSWDPARLCDMREVGNIYRITTDELIVEVHQDEPFHVNFLDRDGRMLLEGHTLEYDANYRAHDYYYETFPIDDWAYGYKLKASFVLPPDEAFFGLGEQAMELNRRGMTIQGWNTDRYRWWVDTNPMYMTLPFFYGVHPPDGGDPALAYGVFFNNPCRPVFRMGANGSDRFSFEAADGQTDFFFFGGGDGHTMKAVLDRYTELTGRPAMLPKWAFGYHQSRYSYKTQAWVQDVAQRFRSENIPLDALYLDIDYMNERPGTTYLENHMRQLRFNHDFPNPDSMIQYCENRNVKLIPLIEPWLQQGDPLRDEAAGAPNYHLVKKPNGDQILAHTPVFGDISWLDFTSTQARNWWKGKLTRFLTDYPFAGIWNDLNEPSDFGLIPLDGLYWMDNRWPGDHAGDSRYWHLCVKNTYANKEASLTYETLADKYEDRRPFVLSRAGFPGIQRYAICWSGDNLAEWAHCQFDIRLGLNVMISGQANFGHDVGGFAPGGLQSDQNPDGELLTRWHEWAVMTPFCRNHTAGGPDGNHNQEPYWYPEPEKTLMVNTIRFRYQLMPYLYSLAYESTQSGEPMNTPAVFQFTSDTATYDQNEYDFMVGPHLLAAPVYTAGAQTRDVHLPNGTQWYDWHTDAEYNGGAKINVKAPLGTLPLFARGGAIVPMGPTMNFVDEISPDYLDIQVWPTDDCTHFRLYEDDGETLDYKDGVFAKTLLSLAGLARHPAVWLLTGARRLGAFDPGRTGYHVTAHAVDIPDQVRKLNFSAGRDHALRPYNSMADLQAQPEGFFYDTRKKQLHVRITNNGEDFAILALDDVCVAEAAEVVKSALDQASLGREKSRPSDKEIDREREMADADAADMRAAMEGLRKVEQEAHGVGNGNYYIQQYYAFSPELTRILTSPEYAATLMPAAAELIVIVGLAADDFQRNGAAAAPNPFSEEDWALGLSMIDQLHAATENKDLQQFLLEIKALSYEFHGKSFAEIFKLLIQPEDLTPPTISGGPADKSLDCRGDLPAPDPDLILASDDSGSVTVIHLEDQVEQIPASQPAITLIHRLYQAIDLAGNTASFEQLFTIQDAPPRITLLGASPMTIARGAAFTDPGASAADVCDGDLSAQLAIAGQVVTAVAGDYKLVYSVSDSQGQTASAQRLVRVVEPNPEEVLNPGTLLLLGFNEGSGKTTLNAANNKKALIYYADWTEGLVAGQALLFPGKPGVWSRVEVAGVQIPKPGAVTLEADVRLDGVAGTKSITGINNQTEWWLENGIQKFSAYYLAPPVAAKTPLQAGQTYRLKATYDPATGRQNVYVNGKLAGSRTVVKRWYPSNAPMLIGNGYIKGAMATPFHGVIDCVRIRNALD